MPTQHIWLIDHNPSKQAIEALRSQLVAHNVAQARIDRGQDLAVFVRDAQGRLVAGIVGWTWGQCLEISYLWVDPHLRGIGYGKRLVHTAEREARARGCHTAVVDTYSFQAPEFYRGLGYKVLGSVDGYPDGHQKLFLKKRL
jgi:ribosomal protein S18 acetylase RimI-like enzyme